MTLKWSHKKEDDEVDFPGSGGKPFFLTFDEAGLMANMAQSMSEMLVFGRAGLLSSGGNGVFAQMYSGSFISDPTKSISIMGSEPIDMTYIEAKKKKLLILNVEINK